MSHDYQTELGIKKTEHVHYQQTFEEYCKHDAMNCSRLMYGFESMLALQEAIEGEYPEPTPGMLFGVDYHKLILEPSEFKQNYLVMQNYAADQENTVYNRKTKQWEQSKSWATKYCKDKKAEFHREAEKLGKVVIAREQFDKAVRMLEAIQRKPKAREIFAECHREATLFGNIEGIDFKGRLDLLGHKTLADLKGAAGSLKSKPFGRTACKFRYPERMAVYRELARQNGLPVDEAWLIVVQTVKPFDCAVYALREFILDSAFERVQGLIAKYKHCLESGDWPGADGGEDVIEFEPSYDWMVEGDESDEVKGLE